MDRLESSSGDSSADHVSLRDLVGAVDISLEQALFVATPDQPHTSEWPELGVIWCKRRLRPHIPEARAKWWVCLVNEDMLRRYSWLD